MLDLTACPDLDCGVPAEIVDRYVLESTSGPVKHMTVHCVAGHHYVHVN